MQVNIILKHRDGRTEDVTDVRALRRLDDGTMVVLHHKAGHDDHVTVESEYGLDWRVESIGRMNVSSGL